MHDYITMCIMHIGEETLLATWKTKKKETNQQLYMKSLMHEWIPLNPKKYLCKPHKDGNRIDWDLLYHDTFMTFQRGWRMKDIPVMTKGFEKQWTQGQMTIKKMQKNKGSSSYLNYKFIRILPWMETRYDQAGNEAIQKMTILTGHPDHYNDCV